MYSFISGPLLWLSFGILIVGLIVRTVRYVRGLDILLDRVAYRSHPRLAIRGALRSIVHWIVPFWSVGWRAKPLFTTLFFVFHIGLVVTPIFLVGHAVLIKQRFGLAWPTIPMALADAFTIGAICAVIFIAIRRIALPEVRIVTSLYDYSLLLVSFAPLLTGFLAAHQAPGGNLFWLYAHILSSEVMLIAIPFTKLYHVVGFFLSRAQIGIDFGVKRDFKGKGFAW